MKRSTNLSFIGQRYVFDLNYKNYILALLFFKRGEKFVRLLAKIAGGTYLSSKLILGDVNQIYDS